ncbi:aldehyde dehydrogenase [Backusella circina FSU 941]|nr:aldehyde dehydrogenase [Backusella circina FSU 941]
MYTSVELIPSIVTSLRETFNSGYTKDIEYRKEQLRCLIRFLKEQEKELCDVLYKDLHKHELEARCAEIAPIIGECEYMIKNLDSFVKPGTVEKQYMISAVSTMSVRKEPKGVVMVIGSWNYPLQLTLLPVVGAIAAGNCVVIKPSEHSLNTTGFIASHLNKYIDPRAYQVIQGSVKETTLLLEQQFDHILYTGSGKVGKIVMAAAAKNLTPVTLELGGKSPTIIAPDTDIPIAASRISWAKYFNCGQTCIAPDYVLITKEKVDEFVKCFSDITRKRFGTNPQSSDSFGRIINEQNFESLKRRLKELHPSKILLGGETDRADLYMAPTLVGPLGADDTELMKEEIFGPILPIVIVEDMNEAIRIVRSKPHPLTLYLFSNDKEVQKLVAENTHSGSLLINDCLMQAQELGLPLGGIGPSGMGYYHGKKSFETFTQERTFVIAPSGFDGGLEMRYQPYDRFKTELMVTATMGLTGSVYEQFKAAVSFMKSFYAVYVQKKEKID